MRQGERLTEAFFNPLEGKVNALEGRERSFQCQISDINGTVKGLMDEVQLQVRRADKSDAKFRHWRKLSEEGFTKLEERLERRQLNSPLAQERPPSRPPSPFDTRPAGTPQAPIDAVSRSEFTLVIERLRRDFDQEIRDV